MMMYQTTYRILWLGYRNETLVLWGQTRAIGGFLSSVHCWPNGWIVFVALKALLMFFFSNLAVNQPSVVCCQCCCPGMPQHSRLLLHDSKWYYLVFGVVLFRCLFVCFGSVDSPKQISVLWWNVVVGRKNEWIHRKRRQASAVQMSPYFVTCF